MGVPNLISRISSILFEFVMTLSGLLKRSAETVTKLQKLLFSADFLQELLRRAGFREDFTDDSFEFSDL